MKSLLINLVFIATCVQGYGNVNKGYVSSKDGVTLFVEGGWDSVRVQRLVDSDLEFILEHIHKPPELKIFIVLGAYGPFVSLRRKNQSIFISVAYDSLTNTDTLYANELLYEAIDLTTYKRVPSNNPKDNHQLNDMYPGNLRMVYPLIEGNVGLKICYQNNWDTVDYYNHLLSIVDYAIRHVEEIKKEQQRICFPAYMKDWEISFVTYDTGKLKAIPIKDWGFTIDPKTRRHKASLASVLYLVICFSVLVSLLVNSSSRI